MKYFYNRLVGYIVGFHMGRNKLINQDQILDAAEKVVARTGPLSLTLETVAIEAGIGKATVVYDFKTKQNLIHALVTRTVDRDNKFNQNHIDELSNQDHSVILGRINAAQSPFPEDFKDVALNLSAALAQDKDLRSIIQSSQKNTISQVLITSSLPQRAILAYLALEGIKLLESLDYYHWSQQERDEILNDIRSLLTPNLSQK